MGKRWESRGETLLEALQNFTPTYDQVKGKSILTIYIGGKKKHEHLYPIIAMRRILSNKIIRMQQAKRLELLISEGCLTNIPKEL